MSDTPSLRLDIEHFLATHWQAKPLLVRDAISHFQPPIDADELAGLAMEEEVESRIIEQAEDDWRLHHGPFVEQDYQRAPPWTLLVQAVDHYVPEVADLRRLFDFIPQWRMDDIMVSYATDGGGVGPHFDNYDVFLLQGEGERLWRVGQLCDNSTALLPHDDLRILAGFETQEEYLLQPGDMLYIPPGVGHWGIARGECTTFSIGFRSPRTSDIVSRWVDRLLEQLPDDEFYVDPRLEPAARPGELRPRDMQRVMAQLQGALDQASGNRWFGELVSEPKYVGEVVVGDPEGWRALLEGEQALLDSAARLFWELQEDGVMVYANGLSELFDLDVLPFVEGLCERRACNGDDLGKLSAGSVPGEELTRLLQYLFVTGCLYVEG